MSDKFIPVTVECQKDIDQPVVDVVMLINTRHITYFSFAPGGQPAIKLIDFAEMPIKNTEEEITKRLNYPILKKEDT
jgi:hypothetical protein